jgi:hypothetical protein
MQDLITKVRDHALETGLFEHVNLHEPKVAPGRGLTCAIWAQDMTTVPTASGLSTTAARIELNLRLFTNMLAEPQDMIDPNLLAAVDTLMTAYHADLTLGGTVHTIDVFGAHGARLRAQAGYVKQDGKLLRVITITLPVIVADVWEQS